MKPKILKSEEDYEAACREVEHLRSLEPGPERDSDLELWSALIGQYGKSVPAAGAPARQDAGASAPEQETRKKIDLLIRPKAPLSGKTWLFFAAMVALLYLRLMYRVTYYPPFFEGEESKGMYLTKDTVDFAAYSHSWWLAFKGGLIEYNKGYFWFMIPFYLIFGYDTRIIIYLLPLIYGVLCGTYFTIYRKTYPKGSLLSYFVPIMFSVLCLALRRYKWHSVTYLAAISVYLYFLPEFYKGAFFLRDRWRKAVAMLLFAVACYLYFGCFTYIVPGLFLVLFFSTKAQRRRDLTIGCVGLVLFAAAMGYFCYTTETWRTRVFQELRSISQDFSHDGRNKVWWSFRDYFFTLDLSVPYLAIWVVGMVSAVKMIRKGDRFALITLAIYVPLWAFQALIGGLNNPDQTNWSMLALLGVLLIGSDRIFGWLQDNVKQGTAAGVILLALIGVNEFNHYLPLSRDTPYQSFIQDRNTRTELALVLRLIKNDDSGSVRYYMPDPSLSQQNGGYEYDSFLPRVEVQETLQKVTFFTSEEDLRNKLVNQKDGKPAVVYLSVGYPPDGGKDTETMPLLGENPQAIHPWVNVYLVEYKIRKFEFKTGPAAASLPVSPPLPL
jgi:hypothetical protein